jgi:hypothetical protein
VLEAEDVNGELRLVVSDAQGSRANRLDERSGETRSPDGRGELVESASDDARSGQIEAGPHARNQDAIGRLDRRELEQPNARALERGFRAAQS